MQTKRFIYAFNEINRELYISVNNNKKWDRDVIS